MTAILARRRHHGQSALAAFSRPAPRAIVAAMNESPEIFDRHALRQHRDRAAATIDAHDFLIREVAERLLDRLGDIRRSFPLALDLGCHHGVVSETLAGRGGIRNLIQTDLSHGLARRARNQGHATLVADEEALPFAPASLDLVISVLSLHWVNDLPGALLQICRALKPDGLFLGALIGGDSLKELRQALMEAEIEIEDGVSPRVSPLADLRDLGGLLQRAGFALPVTDLDSITVTYPSALALMHELRGMGETASDRNRRRGLSRRATLLRAAALYEQRFAGPDGRIPATFEVLYLTGWAAARLAEALGSAEQSGGEKAGRKP
jgi:SAM-dependent methyltransferase